jgi:RimJ/RimL family protein N-acetyltransferase
MADRRGMMHEMTAFSIPTPTTARLRLRASRAGDLEAYAAMQANPEVMRYLITGRTSTRAETCVGRKSAAHSAENLRRPGRDRSSA